MTNEIKEILDRLERIDHKEYSGGFEFADSSTFNEMTRCFEERKKLANYITNLQEEINKLTAESTEWESKYYDLQKENEHLRTQLNTLENTVIEVNKECNKLFNHLTKKDLDYKSRNEKAYNYLDKFIPNEYGVLLTERQWEYVKKILGGDE